MKYTRIREVTTPSGNRKEDAGVDLYIPNDFNGGKPMKLYIGQQVNIPSGIKVKVPAGMDLKIDNKSGVALKKGLLVGATIVDTGYRGEIHINLFKVVRGKEDKRNWFGRYYTTLTPGEKITQGILNKISIEPWTLVTNKEYEKGPKTKRAAGAFGSTGTK